MQPQEQSEPVHSSPQEHSVQQASVQHEPAVAQQDLDCWLYANAKPETATTAKAAIKMIFFFI